MNVQIDRSIFSDKLERRFGGKRVYADQSFDLLDEVYDKAQEWFDDELQHQSKEKDNPRDLRISLKRYIMHFTFDRYTCGNPPWRLNFDLAFGSH